MIIYAYFRMSAKLPLCQACSVTLLRFSVARDRGFGKTKKLCATCSNSLNANLSEDRFVEFCGALPYLSKEVVDKMSEYLAGMQLSDHDAEKQDREAGGSLYGEARRDSGLSEAGDYTPPASPFNAAAEREVEEEMRQLRATRAPTPYPTEDGLGGQETNVEPDQQPQPEEKTTTAPTQPPVESRAEGYEVKFNLSPTPPQSTEDEQGGPIWPPITEALKLRISRLEESLKEQIRDKQSLLYSIASSADSTPKRPTLHIPGFTPPASEDDSPESSTRASAKFWTNRHNAGPALPSSAGNEVFVSSPSALCTEDESCSLSEVSTGSSASSTSTAPSTAGALGPPPLEIQSQMSPITPPEAFMEPTFGKPVATPVTDLAGPGPSSPGTLYDLDSVRPFKADLNPADIKQEEMFFYDELAALRQHMAQERKANHFLPFSRLEDHNIKMEVDSKPQSKPEAMETDSSESSGYSSLRFATPPCISPCVSPPARLAAACARKSPRKSPTSPHRENYVYFQKSRKNRTRMIGSILSK